jgi:glycerophosphoryl diester phosphodiesterase
MIAPMRTRAAAILCVLCGLVPLAAASALASPAIHAHRGGALIGGKPTFPENTMPAFRHAAERGFVLELDVKLTEDRVPVVIHDATLDRVTPCSGEVADRTLAQLGHCKVDILGAEEDLRHLPRGDRRRVPIPTLAQVLGLIRRTGARANIEIKNIPTDPDFDSTPAFARTVVDAIRRSGVKLPKIIVQSFWPPNLDVAQQRLQGAQTSYLTLSSTNEAGIGIADSNGYDWISPQWPVSPVYVSRAHADGLKVVPFTLDTAADIRAAARAGVDALITNEPLRARKVLAFLRQLRIGP